MFKIYLALIQISKINHNIDISAHS